MNTYRHYKNKWLSTHLITILEVCSRAGNDKVSHEILIVTMKHCCTITINVLKINAQDSTTQRLPCPQHLLIPPLLFVYKYATQLAKTITSQLHCLVHACVGIYVYTPRISWLPKRIIGTLRYTHNATQRQTLLLTTPTSSDNAQDKRTRWVTTPPSSGRRMY